MFGLLVCVTGFHNVMTKIPVPTANQEASPRTGRLTGEGRQADLPAVIQRESGIGVDPVSFLMHHSCTADIPAPAL